jgi:Tfp pilus assembly protein PilF
MKVRCVSYALVSAAFLAATAMTCGTAYANPSEDNAALVRKAYATMQGGDALAAVGEYSDAIASDALEPEMLANALLNRALAYQQLQDNKSALADYNAAIKLNVMAPALRSTALYNRGLAQQKMGQLTQAIEDFTAALLINPEFAQSYYCRGNALRDSGQLLFALSDYERALRFNYPDKAKVHFGFATTYLALKRPMDAKREFNEALTINPNYGEARAQLVLLGDENAEAKQAAVDPIMTGSVGVYAGGTNATKPGLPAAVELPPALEAAAVKPRKPKIQDQVPSEEATIQAVAVEAEAKGEEIVEVEKAPEAAEAPVAEEPVAEQQIAAAEPAEPAAEKAAPEEPVAEAAPVEETPAASGWVVQIASATSEDAALSTWKKLQSRHKVLKSKNPSILKADLGAKGIYYRVRLTGFEEQAAAKKECSKLKAGGVSCYISKVGS